MSTPRISEKEIDAAEATLISQQATLAAYVSANQDRPWAAPEREAYWDCVDGLQSLRDFIDRHKKRLRVPYNAYFDSEAVARACWKLIHGDDGLKFPGDKIRRKFKGGVKREHRGTRS